MDFYFFDTSGLVKRYIAETGTTWVTGLTNPQAGNSIYLAEITPVEIVAAITRRGRGGGLASPDAAKALAEFSSDFPAQYLPVSITPVLIASAMRLAAQYGLRGYDAVQLASVLEIHSQHIAVGLPPVVLVSADAELNAAAVAEGLPVENPNFHP